MKLAKEQKFFNEFIKGAVRENPVFVMALGLCPVLGVTTSAGLGLVLGMATLLAVLFSVFVVLIIQKIPVQVKMPIYLMIMAAFVTVEEMVMQIFFYKTTISLGIFIPLIIVNCILLQNIDEEIGVKRVFFRLAKAFGTGAGFAGVLFIVGAIREITGNGTFLGSNVFGFDFQPVAVMIMPAGAFLTMGILIAFINLIKKFIKRS